jgi:RNA polymerase sigma-70 factor (ECF subfamily)
MWLGGIARKHVALHFRKQQRHRRPLQLDDRATAARQQIVRWLQQRQELPEQALACAELAALVRAALAELSSDYETLLTAKYFDGATVEQIAVAQRCSVEAVRSKLARARRAFRRAFGKASPCSCSGHADGVP